MPLALRAVHSLVLMLMHVGLKLKIEISVEFSWSVRTLERNSHEECLTQCLLPNRTYKVLMFGAPGSGELFGNLGTGALLRVVCP